MCGAAARPPTRSGPLPLPPPSVHDEAIHDAAKRLAAARQPLIVAGGGAQDAGIEVTDSSDCCKRRYSAIGAVAACSTAAIR